MNKTLTIIISLTALIGCDRLTKIQAVANLKASAPVSYLGGMFQLTYYENTGAMLSFGSDFNDEIRFIIFTLLVGIALLSGLIYIFIKPIPKLYLAPAILIVGGGLGNLYDRAFNDGAVVDFMVIVLEGCSENMFDSLAG